MGECSTKERSKNVSKTVKNSKDYQNMQSKPVLRKFSVEDKFTSLKKISKGGFGQVFLYQDKVSPYTKYAAKKMKKDFKDSSEMQYNLREINNLRQMDHPNIVNYLGTYEDKNHIYLIMEYVPGITLKDLISGKKSKKLSENDIKVFFKTLISAVSYIHNKGIIHRDIKPNNILLSNKNDLSSLKLIDFGLSINKDDTDPFRVGCPLFMSPEIINGEFCSQSDLWSIGVILYYMVTGHYPFSGDTKGEIFKKIQAGDYSKDALENSWCSKELKDLIKRILKVDLRERITVKECLKHPFLKDDSQKTDLKLDSDIVNSIKDFINKNTFQKEISYLIGRIVPDCEISRLRKLFVSLDQSNSGEISYGNFLTVLKSLGYSLSDDNSFKLFERLDFHKRGAVSYSEFVAAALSSTIEEDKLCKVFHYLDPYCTGYIMGNSIINALKERHIMIDQSSLNKMNFCCKYDFFEFKEMFFASANEQSISKSIQ